MPPAPAKCGESELSMNMKLGQPFIVRLDEYGKPITEGEHSTYHLVTQPIEVRRDTMTKELWCVQHNCKLSQCKEQHR